MNLTMKNLLQAKLTGAIAQDAVLHVMDTQLAVLVNYHAKFVYKFLYKNFHTNRYLYKNQYTKSKIIIFLLSIMCKNFIVERFCAICATSGPEVHGLWTFFIRYNTCTFCNNFSRLLKLYFNFPRFSCSIELIFFFADVDFDLYVFNHFGAV